MDQATVPNRIVPLLTAQHRHITALLDAVVNATGDARQPAFRSFLQFLALHEAAEEEAAHPAARPGAGETVEQRLAEEYHAGQTITQTEQLDPNTAEFDRLLEQLVAAVTAHAHHEEQDEFPALAEVADRLTAIRVHHVVALVDRLAGAASPIDRLPFVDQVAARRQHFRGPATGA